MSKMHGASGEGAERDDHLPVREVPQRPERDRSAILPAVHGRGSADGTTGWRGAVYGRGRRGGGNQ